MFAGVVEGALLPIVAVLPTAFAFVAPTPEALISASEMEASLLLVADVAPVVTALPAKLTAIDASSVPDSTVVAVDVVWLSTANDIASDDCNETVAGIAASSGIGTFL